MLQETLELAREAFERLGLPMHIPVSEMRREISEYKKRHGVFPFLAHLDRFTN